MVEVLIRDPPKLHIDNARARPFAGRTVANAADDRLDLVFADVLRQDLVVEAFGCRHRLRQNLPDRVVERRQVEPKRIYVRLFGPGLIANQKIPDSREVHRLLRRPSVVVHDAVQHGAQRFHDGRVLQPDHAAAEQHDVVADADLVHRTDDRGGIGRIRGDEHRIGFLRTNGADHGREFHGVGRVVLVVDRLQAVVLQSCADAIGKFLRELGVGRENGDGLGAEFAAQRQVGSGPVPGRGPGLVVEVLVVPDLLIDLEREVSDQQQVTLFDQRNDRSGRVGPVGRNEQIDLIHVQELGVDTRRHRRIALVIVHDQLDRAPEQSAACIDVVAPDFQRDQSGFSPATQRAGLCNG